MKDANNLSALIETWTNSDKAQAIKELRKSMSESIERTDTAIVIRYIKDSIKEGLISAKLIDYPEIGFESTARTMFYKKAIQSTLEATESIDKSTDVLSLAWSMVCGSKNLIEFRRHLKMYLCVYHEDRVTSDDVQWYVDQIDSLENEVKLLLEYKRQNNELFGIIESNDEEMLIVHKAKVLTGQGFSDVQIAKVLGISRQRLSYCKGKVKIETVG